MAEPKNAGDSSEEQKPKLQIARNRGIQTNNTGDANEEHKRKLPIAIRCAKAAILVSSLRNNPNYATTNSLQLANEEAIEELKISLVKEKLKNKKLMFSIVFELKLLFVWTLLLLTFMTFYQQHVQIY